MIPLQLIAAGTLVVVTAVQGNDIMRKRVLDLGGGLGLCGAVAAARGATVVMVDNAPQALLFSMLNAWPWRERVTTRLIDWTKDLLEGDSFQWVIAADVLYDRSDWEPLELFWRGHLAPRGAVLVGEPGRSSAGDFPSWLRSRGWTVVENAAKVSGRDKPVMLYQASLDEDEME